MGDDSVQQLVGAARRYRAASGIAVPPTCDVSGDATPIPIASPVYTRPTGAAQRRPLSRSDPTPSSGAVSSPPHV